MGRFICGGMLLALLVLSIHNVSAPKVSSWNRPCDAGSSGSSAGAASSSMAGGVAAAIAGALAAAAATGASGASVGQKRARVGSMTSAINSALRLTTQPLLLNTPPVSVNESDEDEDDECGPNPSDVEEDSDGGGDDALASWLAGVPGSGKLWSKTQFPEGFKGAKNYELLNLSAAHDWTCPCPDQNCLSRERYPSVFTLYEFRKDAQTKSKGFRDTFRSKFLEPAYNRTTRKFTRSCRAR